MLLTLLFDAFKVFILNGSKHDHLERKLVLEVLDSGARLHVGRLASVDSEIRETSNRGAQGGSASANAKKKGDVWFDGHWACMCNFCKSSSSAPLAPFALCEGSTNECVSE